MKIRKANKKIIEMTNYVRLLAVISKEIDRQSVYYKKIGKLPPIKVDDFCLLKAQASSCLKELGLPSYGLMPNDIILNKKS